MIGGWESMSLKIEEAGKIVYLNLGQMVRLEVSKGRERTLTFHMANGSTYLLSGDTAETVYRQIEAARHTDTGRKSGAKKGSRPLAASCI